MGGRFLKSILHQHLHFLLLLVDLFCWYLILPQVFWGRAKHLSSHVVGKLGKCSHFLFVFRVEFGFNLELGHGCLQTNILVISLVYVNSVSSYIMAVLLLSECRETSLRTLIFSWSLEIIIFSYSDIVFIYFSSGNSSELAAFCKNCYTVALFSGCFSIFNGFSCSIALAITL